MSLVEFLKNIEDKDELRKALYDCHILTDELSIALIKKIGGESDGNTSKKG